MSKGAPDYTKMVSLQGRDADGNDVSVLVDSTGRMLAVIQGAVEVAGTMDTNVLNTVREIQGSDGEELRTLALDTSGRILAVMKGAYGDTLATIALDAASRMIGTFTPIQDYSSFWAGTFSRMVVDATLIDCISVLAAGTRIVQRALIAQASGASIGTVKVKYSNTFTYLKAIAGSAILNEESVYIFDGDATDPVVTLTDASLINCTLDIANINVAKNATAVTGANAAKAVDEDMTTQTDLVDSTSSVYATAFSWDIGSVKSVQAYWFYFYLYDTTDAAHATGRLQYSSDNVTWNDFFEWTSDRGGPSPITKKARLANAVSCRYFRWQTKTLVEPHIARTIIKELVLFL